MKRVLALCLMALIMLSAAGCSQLEQAAGTAGPTATPDPGAAIAQPEPSVEPTPTPIPTPEPSPVPVVAIEDYQYQKVSNQALDISFEYPSHWNNVPGNITICYVQPVNPGDAPARVAVSTKKASKATSPEAIKKDLNKLMDKVSGGFQNFRHTAVSRKVKLMNSNAYSVVYRGELNGREVKGLLVVTFKSAKSRMVALHFYAPSEKYDEFQPVLKQVMDTLKLA